MTTGPEEFEQLLLLSKPLFEASEHKHGGRFLYVILCVLGCFAGISLIYFFFAPAKLTFQLFFLSFFFSIHVHAARCVYTATLPP